VAKGRRPQATHPLGGPPLKRFFWGVAHLQGVEGSGLAGPNDTSGCPWPPLAIHLCEFSKSKLSFFFSFKKFFAFIISWPVNDSTRLFSRDEERHNSCISAPLAGLPLLNPRSCPGPKIQGAHSERNNVALKNRMNIKAVLKSHVFDCRPAWHGCSTDSLKFHAGPPCPTLIRPSSSPLDTPSRTGLCLTAGPDSIGVPRRGSKMAGHS
jgi:hypothetical protein